MVEQWLETDYPKMKALAQREKAEIFFGDRRQCAPIVMPGTLG